MNRLNTAVNALIDAYSQERIHSASCRKCAVGTIILESTGQSSDKWWRTLLSFVTGEMDLEDSLYANYLEKATGYTLMEIYLIEAAFEGEPFIPGIRRLAQSSDVSLEQRLADVIERLHWLEEHSEEDVRHEASTMIQSYRV